MAPNILIQRVRIENYRSIAHCDVELKPLTFVVGQNGSGKSNFLDALAFLGEQTNALGPTDLRPRQQQRGSGSVRFGAAQGRVVAHLIGPNGTTSATALVNDVATGGGIDTRFANTLARLAIYAPDLARLRANPRTSKVDWLFPDCSNVAKFIGELKDDSERRSRWLEYIRAALPFAVDAGAEVFANDSTDLYVVEQGREDRRVYSSNLSDGTLRVLCLLTALFQPWDKAPIIGIEEPETSLHFEAIRALRHAMQEVSAHRQVIVSTHSADLLDFADLDAQSILLTARDGDATVVEPLDRIAASAIEDRVATVGELLRTGFLRRRPELIGHAD